MLLRRLYRSLREKGLARTLRNIRETLRVSFARDAFDRTHGTNTSGVLPLWLFRIHSPNRAYGVRYQPTDAEEIENIIGCLVTPPMRKDYTFVDLGCGKGRTLLVAGQMGFRRVEGIEFSGYLCRVADKNLAITNTTAQVKCVDASDYAFDDGPILLYLFNPFREPVLFKVIENLRQHKNSLIVIYKTPIFAKVLDGCGFLERLSVPGISPHVAVWKRSVVP
jgi:SAM-dependent methyltransferase